MARAEEVIYILCFARLTLQTVAAMSYFNYTNCAAVNAADSDESDESDSDEELFGAPVVRTPCTWA